MQVWEDPVRHRAMHAWYAAAGRDGMRNDFLAHIRRDLAAGRRVYVMPGWNGAPFRDWVSADGELALESADGSRRIWRVVPRR